LCRARLMVGRRSLRMASQAEEAKADVRQLEAKLANEQFRTRAPAAVVGKEDEKLARRPRSSGGASDPRQGIDVRKL